MADTAPNNQSSKLQIYSWGVAAENKPLNTNKLKVVPTEAMSLSDGELRSSPEVLTTTGTNADGTPYDVPVVTDQAVEALWLPLAEGNRFTAPDIRRGERVILWKFADMDRFFWTPAGLDNQYRRLETAVFAFSAVANEGQDATHPENCYFLEVSTHQKTVTFQTSNKNGEACRFIVQFNADEGKFILSDDAGNEIELDSLNNYIQLINGDKTEVVLDRRSVRIKASDVTIDAKDTTVTGDLKIGGNVTIGGNLKISGSTQANGITSSATIQGPRDSI